MPVLPRTPRHGLRETAGDYDGAADMARSLDACYGAIRDRVAAGGPAWAFPGLPRNHYAAIVADPPWHFETWSAKGRDRSPDYPTLRLDQVAELPVGTLAAPDCALFLWAIDPMLPAALELGVRWGFTYKTVAFYWAKIGREAVFWRADDFPLGTGYWTRSNPEQCLLFTRGKPKRLSRAVRKLIVSPRREHSRKPDETMDRIERLVAGPYLELFARHRRHGWDSWGDEL